jgi:hydroxyacylglutathione hydrolase
MEEQSMKIEAFPLGVAVTNAYLLIDDTAKNGVVVDPGVSPGKLVKRIRKLGLSIEAILLTHAHFDHIAGLEEVRIETGAPVYIHDLEQDWLGDPNKNLSALWPGLDLVRCRPAERVLKGGETLHLLGREVKVLHTPGHSPGSLSYVFGSAVFSGDVLFKDGIGRFDLPGGDYDTLMKSINEKLMELPEETAVYPGHGPQTTIGREQAHNPHVTGLY